MHRALLLSFLGLILAVPVLAQSPFLPEPAPAAPPDSEATKPLVAPTRLFSEPQVYFLLRLPGDFAHVRYVAGSLDRAANVQTRLEISARAFKRWTGHQVEYTSYVLSREEWDKAGIPVPFGMPTRIGRHGIATATLGDDGTVQLWSHLLRGQLPDVDGAPIRGTPLQAASMVVSDLILQLQAAEILVDEIGLGGDQHWVRGVVAHLAAAALTRRHEPRREPGVLALWQTLGATRPDRALAAGDYSENLSLEDWLWFQARFRVGATILLDEMGRGSLKKMRKLEKKGELTGHELLARWEKLEEWYLGSFSGVPRL